MPERRFEHQDLQDGDLRSPYSIRRLGYAATTPEHLITFTDRCGRIHHWLHQRCEPSSNASIHAVCFSGCRQSCKTRPTNLENRGRCVVAGMRDGVLEFRFLKSNSSPTNSEIPVAAITEIESRQSKRFHVAESELSIKSILQVVPRLDS